MADEIIAKNDGAGDFELPPEGETLAVCVDVIDLGMHQNATFGKLQHKVALVFWTALTRKDGTPFEIAQRFTLSMYESAYLRKFLGLWRGKSYSDEEATAGAPLHKLVGVGASLVIEHNKKGDKTYANVLSIGRAPKGSAPIDHARYERAAYWQKVKEAGGLGGAPATAGGVPDEDDDALPF